MRRTEVHEHMLVDCQLQDPSEYLYTADRGSLVATNTLRQIENDSTTPTIQPSDPLSDEE